LYIKEKPPLDKIIDFNETMKVKMQLSMGYKIVKDYNLIRMEKQDKQQKIQKFIMCFLDFLFAWYSIVNNNIAQLHSFGGMSWMIGVIADNIKSLQYYEYIEEYLTYCEALESFSFSKPLMKEELGEIDKVQFINGNFGYYRDDLTKNPDYDQKIFNLNFTFYRGNLYYLEAPNGVGKSTILKMFKYNLYTGQVFFGSVNRANLSFDDICSSVFYIAQASEYTPQFSKEQINSLKGKDLWLEERLGLERLFDKDTTEMSGGQKKRLFIYVVLTSKAPILLLDEILSELSTEECSEVPEGGGWLNRVIRTIVEWQGLENKLIIMVGHGLRQLIPSKNNIIKLSINNQDRETKIVM
jgi:ABC-type cobalamin/Fe3+-siderophores transport system ATPase subunit